MWRFVESIGRVPIYENDLKVATAYIVEDAARIVAAMNAAEAKCTYARTCVPGNRDPRCPVHAPKSDEPARKSRSTLRREAIQRGEPMPTFEAEPARKSVCGTCGGSGETEEDATGALGYVVKKPCPDCAGGR